MGIVEHVGTCKNCRKNDLLDKGVCEICWYELGYDKPTKDEKKCPDCQEFLHPDGIGDKPNNDLLVCNRCGYTEGK